MGPTISLHYRKLRKLDRGLRRTVDGIIPGRLIRLLLEHGDV